jgi:hypothetical protein
MRRGSLAGTGAALGEPSDQPERSGLGHERAIMDAVQRCHGVAEARARR